MPTPSFQDFQLSQPILKALEERGYEEPTPIQAEAIPLVTAGHDVIGTAQTGTGKTAAFALPIIESLANGRPSRTPRALVLTPTRELALQIEGDVAAYAKHLPLTTCVLLGGVPLDPQIRRLKSGVDFLIATPGRLLDLVRQRYAVLGDVKFFVLDEADRMLDMGFVHDVRLVVDELPKARQGLLFSATMSAAVRSLASTMLTDPQSVSVAPPASVADNIDQRVMYVDKGDKKRLLEHLVREEVTGRTLVFTRTKDMAAQVARHLKNKGIRADAIHSNKNQRQRERTLEAFSKGRLRVLVATDIVARGIDVKDISHVINYELPDDPEAYIHRIGRTARAGHSGVAVALCDLSEVSQLRYVERLTGIPLNVDEDQPFHDAGIAACRTAADRAARIRSRAGRGRGSGSKWAR
ncbi:MAG: DEAD/DEAH box helicase [bacterium]|nr:DEAD/DEAH box helicase [bacterium]